MTIALLLLLAAAQLAAAQVAGGGLGAGSGRGVPPQAPPQPGVPTSEPAIATAAISGVVIDGETKAPLAGSLVALSVAGSGANYQTRQLTDARGRFAFPNLPAGRYSITASLYGYLDGGPSRDNVPGAPASPIAVADQQWVADVRVALWQPSTISGSVFDEGNEPVVGVLVRVLPRLRVQGRDVLVAGPLAATDDRGAYRVTGLLPGRYVVQVPSVQPTMPIPTLAPSAMPAATAAGNPNAEPALEVGGQRLLLRNFPTPPPPMAGRPFSYPPTFHPGTTMIASAATVDLRGGEQRSGVDVTLTPTTAWRVSGVVEGPPEALARLSLRLLPEGMENLGNGSEVATASVGTDGRFTFLNVPAGTYTIDAPRTVAELTMSRQAGSGVSVGSGVGGASFGPPAGLGNSVSSSSFPLDAAPPGVVRTNNNYRGTAPNFEGRTTIVVGGHDEDSAIVRMRPTGTLTGRIVVDPAVPREEAATLPPQGAPFLDPSGVSGARINGRRVSQDSFTIEAISPAKFLLRWTLGNWMVKSITWQGHDYTDTPFDATQSPDFSNVEMVVTDAIPSISGHVRDAQGSPTEAIVIIFPVDRTLRAEAGFSPARIKRSTTDATGAYKQSSLPAGDYFVVAVDRAHSLNWFDADFLASIERVASRLSLGWGEGRVADLTLAPLR